MRKFIEEFKEFAFRGNVMNLAVGVIIGGVFQGVVTSLTQNILSPIIGLFAGQNFDLLSISIFDVEIMYGAFITSVVNFIIMALVIFVMVKAMNKLGEIHKKPEELNAEVITKKCPFCLSDIPKEASRCSYCTSQL